MRERSTKDAILAAAYDTVLANGMSHLAVGDVARRAGVSRQTVYRHFPSRRDLLVAVVLQEHRAFLGRVRAAATAQRSLRGAVEALTAEVLRTAREHPLFDRLLNQEPEALLPLLTGQQGALLPEVAPMVAELLAERLPHVSAVRIDRTADAIGRLLISYAVNPGDASADEVAAGLAAVVVDGLKEER